MLVHVTFSIKVSSGFFRDFSAHNAERKEDSAKALEHSVERFGCLHLLAAVHEF